jgi:hypothetical protein
MPAEHGHDTAKAIPCSELFEIEGMRHDLPQRLFPCITDPIAGYTKKVETARR